MFNDRSVKVLEYSKMTNEQVKELNRLNNKLMFRDGDIGSYFFVIEFLEYAKHFTIPEHLVEFYDCQAKVNRFKLENFITDAFAFAR